MIVIDIAITKFISLDERRNVKIARRYFEFFYNYSMLA